MWLNIPINGGMYLPKEKQDVEYRGKKLVLCPPTKEYMPSIHIEYEDISYRVELSTINELLSILAWKSNQPAIIEDVDLELCYSGIYLEMENKYF